MEISQTHPCVLSAQCELTMHQVTAIQRISFYPKTYFFVLCIYNQPPYWLTYSRIPCLFLSILPFFFLLQFPYTGLIFLRFRSVNKQKCCSKLVKNQNDQEIKLLHMSWVPKLFETLLLCSPPVILPHFILPVILEHANRCTAADLNKAE